MDDDKTRRSLPGDDPGATGPLWPPVDDDLLGEDDDLARTRGARPNRKRGGSRPDADHLGSAPDLESTVVLQQGASGRRQGADPTRVASDGARDWLDEPLPVAPAPPRVRAGRLRPRGSGLSWPRIVAPVVLLAAIIAVVTLGVHSGLLGNKATPAASHPVVSTSPIKGKSKYLYYRVKKGDSMSTIAAKYNLTLGELLALNPRASSSTIAIGEKLKVPRLK
jgi:LysM repeat protein